MSSTGEEALSCNTLFDKHSENYQQTVAYKYPAHEVRAMIDKVVKQGFEVRLKTEEEISADIEVFRLAKKNIIKKRRVRTIYYTDTERQDLLQKVNDLLISAGSAAKACEKAGVNYKSYLAWRMRYKSTNHK